MVKKLLVSLVLGAIFIISAITMANTKYELPLRVYYSQLSPSVKTEIECLTDNIFFEAAHEPDSGKQAVAFVTINRMNSGFFPKSICGVVKQKTQNVCQFSWYCEEKPHRLSYTKDLTHHQQALYNEIRKIAIHVYANYDKITDPTKGALFYHADYVNPQWRNMIHTATIGRHIFYIRKDMI